MGAMLHLKGKSRKGKNRIREHGPLWRLTRTEDKVFFSDRKGPWLHIESLRNKNYGRWINEFDDEDMSVIEKIEAKDE